MKLLIITIISLVFYDLSVFGQLKKQIGIDSVIAIINEEVEKLEKKNKAVELSRVFSDDFFEPLKNESWFEDCFNILGIYKIKINYDSCDDFVLVFEYGNENIYKKVGVIFYICNNRIISQKENGMYLRYYNPEFLMVDMFALFSAGGSGGGYFEAKLTKVYEKNRVIFFETKEVYSKKVETRPYIYLNIYDGWKSKQNLIGVSIRSDETYFAGFSFKVKNIKYRKKIGVKENALTTIENFIELEIICRSSFSYDKSMDFNYFLSKYDYDRFDDQYLFSSEISNALLSEKKQPPNDVYFPPKVKKIINIAFEIPQNLQNKFFIITKKNIRDFKDILLMSLEN